MPNYAEETETRFYQPIYDIKKLSKTEEHRTIIGYSALTQGAVLPAENTWITLNAMTKWTSTQGGHGHPKCRGVITHL